MPWSHIVNGGSALAGLGLGIAGLYQSSKQAELQEYFSRENLALAREAFEAQQNQQALENEWYLDNRDYQRSLQQQIFNREDTAMQRARADFEAAGFSPLAAVGNMAGAGQVVASAQSPGNMVSNNQSSAQVSNFVGDSLDAMASRLDSASGRVFQEMLASKQMKHDQDMQDRAHDKAVELKILDIYEGIISSMYSVGAQEKLQELIGQQNLDVVKQQGQNAMNLQNDQQEWHDSQPKSRDLSQIAEQFFNWLQKEDPLIGELTKGYSGWEIGFKAVKELLYRQFGVSNKKDKENPYVDAEEKLESSGYHMPDGWF